MATHAEEPDPRLGQLAERIHRESVAGQAVGSVGAPAAAELLDEAGRAALERLIAVRRGGLGPLADLLTDDSIDEITVTGTGPVYVERGGLLQRSPVSFESELDLRAAIERILGEAGRRADESSPYCDARLPDGSRVNVVLPPLAVDGPVLTIRKFRTRWPSVAELAESGSWEPEAAALLTSAVRERKSILVSGGTGSGKTTALAAVASLAEPTDRVIVIEDTAELALSLPHVVRLEARPANVEGRGAVTIRDLVRNALRMRPDRLIVGEVRGVEVVDMIAAMTTGHDGSLSTVHASSAQGALDRLRVLCAAAGEAGSAAERQISESIGLIAHLRRRGDGKRVLDEIAEVRDVAGMPRAYPVYRAPAR